MRAKYLVLMASTALVLFSTAATAQQGSNRVKVKFQSIEGDGQLIVLPGAGEEIDLARMGGKQDVRKWVEWPKADRLKSPSECDNRAQTKEDHPGGDPHLDDPRAWTKSPQDAAAQAVQWVRGVVRKEYIPPDLDKRMLALQEKSPADSMMACRWTVDDTDFQVIQSVARTCVVIQAEENLRAATNDDKEFALMIVDMMIVRGSDTIHWGATEMPRPNMEIMVFRASDPPDWRTRPVSEAWWARAVWYTAGRSVAVFLAKNQGDGSYVPSPKQPWF